MDKSTYILRQSLGWLGAALPFMCLIFGALGMYNEPTWFHTMSQTFYTPAITPFVGVLWAVGIFLIAYGAANLYDYWGDRVVNIASGIFAIGVAVFPCQTALFTHVGMFMLPVGTSAILHYISAGGLFIMLAINILWLFRKGKSEVHNRIYLICGLGIVFGFLLIGATVLFGLWGFLGWIAEAIMLLCFSFAWLVKGKAFKLIS